GYKRGRRERDAASWRFLRPVGRPAHGAGADRGTLDTRTGRSAEGRSRPRINRVRRRSQVPDRTIIYRAGRYCVRVCDHRRRLRQGESDARDRRPRGVGREECDERQDPAAAADVAVHSDLHRPQPAADQVYRGEDPRTQGYKGRPDRGLPTRAGQGGCVRTRFRDSAGTGRESQV
ncbi:MAG: hypothetical protein AVDCRST_MAG58-2543, partial [uncultured Rubrobacteraceae bacterium]